MASNKTRNSGMSNTVRLTPQINPSVPPPMQDDEEDQQDQQPPTQPTGQYPTDPEELLAWLQTATPADVDGLLTDLRASAIDNDNRQQDDDITRFFNQIGWTSRLPDVQDEATYQQTWQAAGKPTQMYHTDAPYGGVGARQFAQQFMGNGADASGTAYRQYMSNGVYGNGTYFADSALDSASYGTSQFRGFLNGNAKIVSYRNLSKQLYAMQTKSRGFAKFFNALTGGYSGTNYHSDDAAISVFAAMKGYNVIYNGYNYYTLLDRSALTMSSMTKKATTGMRNW